MQDWMLQIGIFLERAEAALQTVAELHPVVVPNVDLTDKSGVYLNGCFSLVFGPTR
jgi:hypothetical protein